MRVQLPSLMMKAVAKQRARDSKHGGKYTPSRTKEFEKVIATWYKAHSKHFFEKGMVGMFLTFAFEPAPSLSKKKREALIDCRWHTIKPDMDNLEKAIKDGLNKVAYSDDCQVAFVCKTKIYSDESYIDIVLMDADEFKMKEVE